MADVLSHIDAYDLEHGYRGVRIESQQNPLGLFAHQLARAVAGIDVPPIEQRQLEQESRARERAAAARRIQEAKAIRDERQSDPLRRERHEQLIAVTRDAIRRARDVARVNTGGRPDEPTSQPGTAAG